MPVGLLWTDAADKQKNMNEKKRKDYVFRRQFNENPSTIPGCPGKNTNAVCSLSPGLQTRGTQKPEMQLQDHMPRWRCIKTGSMTASDLLWHGYLDGSDQLKPLIAVVKSTTFERLQQPANGNVRTAVIVQVALKVSPRLPLTRLKHQMLAPSKSSSYCTSYEAPYV